MCVRHDAGAEGSFSGLMTHFKPCRLRGSRRPNFAVAVHQDLQETSLSLSPICWKPADFTSVFLKSLRSLFDAFGEVKGQGIFYTNCIDHLCSQG